MPRASKSTSPSAGTEALGKARHRDAAARGDRGDPQERPPRPRRRRVSHRTEVGHRPQSGKRTEVRRLQRRRRRSGRIHGPERAGRRSAPHPGRDGHRRLRRRRQPGISSTSAPNTRWPSSGSGWRSSRPNGSACSGNRIFESQFNFRIDLRIGAGAFVCGEETALIRSIEGRRGRPRPRPPYPSERGLWGMPTLINNVETYANIAPIIRNGSAWFAGIGTPKSTGTKVFALAGKIRNTGLIEVPMGIPLRKIIFDIGGGTPEGTEFKAAQTGGPSGGCIPAEHLDLPVDYESLATVGSIMGSGGLIVMDSTSKMVDVAKYFMEFCMDESCGKCIPCRVGTVHIHGLLDKISQGEGDSRRPRAAGRAVRDGQGDQPLRPRPVRPQSGPLHAPFLPARVRGAPASSRRPSSRPERQRADNARARDNDHGRSVTLTIDGEQVSAKGRRDAAGRSPAQHERRHPDALPPGRPHRRRRLPALPRGGGGIDQARPRLHDHGRWKGWWSAPTPKA